jgi:putative redox protein
MKFLVESADDVASRVRLGSRELVFDQPASGRGGGDLGPSPLDVLVASVAACAHYFAAPFLQAGGPTHRLTIEVEADKESVPTPRIGRLAMKVRAPEGLSDQQLIGIVRAIKRCPAYGTLAKSPTVELSVEIARDSGSAALRPDEHASA